MCPVLSLQPLMKTDRHTGRFSGGQTDSKREAGRQKDRQMGIQVGRQTDLKTQTGIQAGRKRDTDRYLGGKEERDMKGLKNGYSIIFVLVRKQTTNVFPLIFTLRQLATVCVCVCVCVCRCVFVLVNVHNVRV